MLLCFIKERVKTMKKICKVITISKKKKVDKELIKVLLVFVIGVVLVLSIPILFSLFIVK